jgi:hypothetical protein
VPVHHAAVTRTAAGGKVAPGLKERTAT